MKVFNNMTGFQKGCLVVGAAVSVVSLIAGVIVDKKAFDVLKSMQKEFDNSIDGNDEDEDDGYLFKEDEA